MTIDVIFKMSIIIVSAVLLIGAGRALFNMAGNSKVEYIIPIFFQLFGVSAIISCIVFIILYHCL